MALQVLVNNVDVTNQILTDSFTLEENITDETDILTFTCNKFGSRTFNPQALQEVIVNDGATRIFGGNIIEVKRNVEGVDRNVLQVTCKDYSHIMDRYLVIERFQDRPVLNIICEIMNRYVNKDTIVTIADFEATEIWDAGVADTTNFRTGDQSLRLTSSNLVTTVANRTVLLNLQPSGFSATTDYIDIDVFVDDATKLSSCVIRIGDGAAATNYFQFTLTGLVTGANHKHVLKSSATTVGSPSWTAVTGLQLRVTATSGNTVNVSFDNWNVLTAASFTRAGAEGATQVVKYIAFNYSQVSKALQRLAELFSWNWYVDQNKDIHFFDVFDETAPFNLTDTAGTYDYRSLELVDRVDQLRNAVYVRGGDYLAASVPDDLSSQTDGVNKIFHLGFKYANYTLTVGGVRKAVGIDNIDGYTSNIGVFQNVFGAANLALGDDVARTNHSQQVIVTKHGKRSAIKLRVRKVGNPVDNFLLQIVSSSATNLPTGPALSTIASIAGATLTTSYTEQTIVLTEASSASLIFDADQKYNINIGRSGAIDAVNYYQIDVANTGQYDGVCSTNNAGTYTANAYDFYFQELIDYHVLYSFQEKIITFPSAPAVSTSIVWNGQPYKPVLVVTKDYTSISTYGELQFRVYDPSIKSTQGAVQRANQELLSWAEEVTEGSFETKSAGLHAGMTITIGSAVRGITNEDYLIKRVLCRMRSPTTMYYQVTIASKRTLSLIYYLQRQLINLDNQNVTNDDEILEKVENILETITLSDSISTTLGVARFWSDDALTTPMPNQYNGGAGYQWQ